MPLQADEDPPSAWSCAGQAIGSTVARVTGRSPYCSTSSGASLSGAVAAGTSSRRATHSASSARPSNGRATKTSRIFSASGRGLGALASFDACSRRHSLEPLPGGPARVGPASGHAAGQPTATRPGDSRPGRTRPRRSGRGRPGRRPSARPARRRCASPRPSTASGPAARVAGRAAGTAVGHPDLDGRPAPSAAAARPPGPRRRAAGRRAGPRCRPVRRRRPPGRRAVGAGTRPASSSASRCRASRAPRAWWGTTTHHDARVPSTAGSSRSCLPWSPPAHRAATRAAAAPLRPYRHHLADVRIPIRFAAQRSGGRDTGRARHRRYPAPVPGLALPEPSKARSTCSGRMPTPRSVTRNDTVCPSADAHLDRGVPPATTCPRWCTARSARWSGCAGHRAPWAGRRGRAGGRRRRRSAGKVQRPPRAAPRRGRTGQPARRRGRTSVAEVSSRSTSRASSLAR